MPAESHQISNTRELNLCNPYNSTVCVFVCVYMCVCVYVCVCASSVCIYTHNSTCLEVKIVS